MRRISELIRELCPEGVNRRPLSELTSLRAGDRIVKSMMRPESLFPVYGGGSEPTGRFSDHNFEDALTISRAGSAGSVNWIEGPFWATDVCFVASQLEGGPDLKFVYYLVKSQEFELKRRIYGGSMPKLDKRFLWNLPIPVPPISVQKEVVRILDTFTELEGELEGELEARTNQFRHYCDSAYRDDFQRVSYLSLGEVGTFAKGSGMSRSDLSVEGEPCIHYGDIHTRYGAWLSESLTRISSDRYPQLRKAKPGNLVIADTAEDVEGVATATAWMGDREVGVGGHILVFDHTLDPLYATFFFRSRYFQEQKVMLSKGVKVMDISAAALSKIRVPVPDMASQQRIGIWLRDLDSLVGDVNIGLPAEIAARRKQYEYYRDKLLSFERLAA